MHLQKLRLITCCVVASGIAHGQDAAPLLQRMQTALGGPRLFEVRDIDWEVKARVWDGAGHEAGSATRRERIILPYQSRKDQDMHVSKDQVLHTRFYFDGRSGWGSFADMAKFKDAPVTTLEGPSLSMVRREVRGFWLNLWRAEGYEVSLCGPNTKVIPGHGAIVDKAFVTAHRDMIVAIRDRVAQLVRQGKTLEEVMAAKPTADYDSKVTGVGTTGERFVGQLYAELKTAN